MIFCVLTPGSVNVVSTMICLSRKQKLAGCSLLLISLIGCGGKTNDNRSPAAASKDAKQASPTPSEREQSGQKARRLPPSAFAQLPPEVLSQLESRRCTVPQVYDISTPHNLIRGSFALKGQTDWAVLCSKEGQSSILIFWGKPTQCPGELALEKDAEIEYSRKLNHYALKVHRLHRD